MSQMVKTDYYGLLELSPGASAAEVNEACERELGLLVGGSDAIYSLYSPAEKEAIVRQIREAREVLLDPARKAAYDAAIAARQEPQYTAELDVEELKEALSGRSTSGIPVKFSHLPPVAGKMNDIIGEQYRVLYTKLQHMGSESDLKVVAVTSAVKGEGKSATSLNLAYVIAKDFKKKVLLIECDMRKPSMLSKQIGREGSNGLSDIILGRADAGDTVCRVEETSLYLLTCGAGIKNSSELIDSPRLKELLDRFRKEFDYIIVDTPPILPLMDMNILSRLADGLILVIRASHTPKKIVLKAVQSVSGARFIGAVLNGADKVFSKYYY